MLSTVDILMRIYLQMVKSTLKMRLLLKDARMLELHMTLQAALVSKLLVADGTLKLFLIVVTIQEVLGAIAFVAQAFEADWARERKAATVDTDFMAFHDLGTSERLATVQAVTDGTVSRTWRQCTVVLQDRTNIPSVTRHQ